MAEKVLNTIKKEEAKAKLPQVPRGTDLSGKTVTLQNGQQYQLKGASSGSTPTTTVPAPTTPPTRKEYSDSLKVEAKPLPKIQNQATVVKPQTVSAVASQYNDGIPRDAAGHVLTYNTPADTQGGKFNGETGDLEPGYIPSSQEDIDNTVGLTPEMRTKWYANYYKSKGMAFDPAQIPGSFEEATNLFFDNQKAEKDELDRIIDSQVSQYRRNTEANSSAIDSQFSSNREGIVSESNKVSGDAIKNEVLATTNRMIDQLQSQKAQLARLQQQQQQQYLVSREDQIDATRKAIAEAQAKLAEQQSKDFQNTISLVNAFKDNPALAYLSPEQQAAFQSMIPDFPGLISGLAQNAKQTYYDKYTQTKFENQNKAIQNFKSLSEMGVQITPNMAIDIAKSTGLPVDTVLSFNEAAQRIQSDKQLDTDGKKLANLKLSQEIDRISQGLNNETIAKFEYLKDMYRKGESPEAIALFKKFANIQDQDDPMYQADLLKKGLENQVLSIGLQYLPDEKQIDLVTKMTDLNTKKLMLSYLPAEKQVQLALDNAQLDVQNIIKSYLPYEKEATYQKLLQDLEKGDIEMEWLPKEKQNAYDRALVEITNLGLETKSKEKGLSLQDYDLVIKAAEANNAPAKTIAELTKLKAEARKAQLENAEITGETVNPEGYSLGSVASKYESGGDYGRISSGVGDPGGKSYGKYQFASNMGSLKNFINESGYAKEFEDTIVGKSAFDKKWQELAKTPAFQKAQDKYIENHYFQPFKDKMIAAFPGLANRAAAIDEMFWSTSVQYGPNTSIVSAALSGKDVDTMSDADIINAVQDAKLAAVGRSAKTVQQGLKNRIAGERNDLIKLDKDIVRGTQKPKVDEAQVQSIRKEYTAQPAVEDFRLLESDYGNFQKIRDQYSNGQIDKPTRDLALARLFQQMMTQRTIMRENDFARLGDNQGLIETANNIAQRAVNGGDLDDNQVNSLLNTAESLFKSATDSFVRSSDFYASEADRLGIDKARTLGQYASTYEKYKNQAQVEHPLNTGLSLWGNFKFSLPDQPNIEPNNPFLTVIP